MDVLVKLDTAGLDVGPFMVYSNLNNYEAPAYGPYTKSQLTTGVVISMPESVTSVKVRSNGKCTSSIIVNIGAPTSKKINVKSFGATGDGVTDDTIAIQNAIDYMNSSEIVNLYFPTGTYIVTTGFNILDNHTIYGDGPNSTVIKLNKTTYYNDFATEGAMFMGRPSYGHGDENDGVNDGFGNISYPPPYGPNSSKTTLNIIIKDLTIDLNKDLTNYTNGYQVLDGNGDPISGLFRPPMERGIIFNNPVNCIVQNVKILNPWSGGILFRTTIDGTETKDNTIQNVQIIMQEWYAPNLDGTPNYNIILPNYGLYPYAGSMPGIEMYSYHDYSTNNGAACYDRDGANPPNQCNCASKIEINYNDDSYIESRAYSNTITGCTISGGSHSMSLQNIRNNTITNNTIINGSNRGIAMYARSHNNEITHNNITLCGSADILLGYGCFENNISHNIISDVRGGEGEGIALQVNCINNVIEYNTITNIPEAGIRLTTGPVGNTIRYNTITGTSQTDQMGIQLLANWLKYYYVDTLRYGDELRADDNIITNNTMSNLDIGIYLGDEKGFNSPIRYNNNTVNSNVYTNVGTNEDLNIMSYNGVTTDYNGIDNTQNYSC